MADLIGVLSLVDDWLDLALICDGFVFRGILDMDKRRAPNLYRIPVPRRRAKQTQLPDLD